MVQYVAFLRGVNVGGQNKVAMPLLKQVFEDHGFKHVKTYINSGNIIFSSSLDSLDILKQECEAIIHQAFSLSIVVSIQPIDVLKQLLHNALLGGKMKIRTRFNTLFL